VTGHYFDADPAAGRNPRTLSLHLPDLSLSLATDAGVFSAERVDSGTRVLLSTAGDPHGASLLDLGCGYGPIALTLASRAPQATVYAIDVNARARGLCAANAAANSLSNVAVHAPEEVDPELRFDEIWSNPPIRIGKAALHELLTTWLDRLTPTGRALLVVQKHLGADSLLEWLNAQGYPTTRQSSRQAYRILEVRPCPR
jgi:16S rRNA (guanine1207-N2)-methyltransferase